MEKQIIISISREYGSGGREIGEKLANKLEMEFYDRKLLESIYNVNNIDTNVLHNFDEKARKKFFSRTVRGMSNSPELNLAEMQFNLLKQRAADGDSFVVLGRCSDEIFLGLADVVKIFIRANLDAKVKRVMTKREMDAVTAVKPIDRHDKKRRAYHDYFCQSKWGDVSAYDICIDSSKLDIDGTVEFLYEYIQRYLAR